MQLRQDVTSSTCWVRAKCPPKSQGRVVLKDKLRYERSTCNWVVRLKIPSREKVFSTESRNIGSKAGLHILQKHLAPDKNSGTGSSRGVIQKRQPHERSPCAPKFEEVTRDHLTTRKMRPQSSMELGENRLQAQQCGQGHVLLCYWSSGNAGAHFQLTGGKRNSWLIPELQCTCWAKVNSAQKKCILWWDPQPLP